MSLQSARPAQSAPVITLDTQPDTQSQRRFQVAGVDVNAYGFDEAVGMLLDAPRDGQRLSVHFAAFHTFVEASKDPALRQVLASAQMVTPDGMPIVWLGRLQGKRVERVCGPDTMLAVLDRSRERGYGHYFYGATSEIVDDLVSRMSQHYPGLKVAGVYSPPFRPLTDDEIVATVAMINQANPDYVWVGLGSPKQDHWVANFRPLLNAPVLLAVGAAFDFHAGRKKRAPRWMQRWGLEWTFRLASDPRRLGWRYLAGGSRFARLLLADSLRRREAKV